MRGLRPQSSPGLELRTADEMDVDVAGKKKSHLSSSTSKAPHAPDDVGGAVQVDDFRLNDDVGARYTTDTRG